MSMPRKRWDDHSARWKREAERQGLSKSRWDSWFKLSAKSRKIADPRKYAAGQSVADQRRATLEKRALSNMSAKFPTGRRSTMLLGIEEMTTAQLRWTANAGIAQLKTRARMKYASGERNPWWYN